MKTFFTFPRSVQLLVLVGVAVLFRVAVHLTYLPWWAGDTGGYSWPAWAIYTGHFQEWDGARTPGYPFFLIACELLAGNVSQKLSPLDGQIITWSQSALGVLSVVFVYLTMERLLIRPWIRFFLSLFYALLFPIAEFEMIILSDFLCLFFTTASVFLMAVTVDRLRRDAPVLGMAAWTGIASAGAVLVRPNALFVGLFFIGMLLASSFFLISNRSRKRALWQVCGICGFSGGFVLALLIAFNGWNMGDFTLTPITGLVRTSAAYNLFDQVHPEDHVVGEIMVRYYHQTNRPGAVVQDFVTTAFPEMIERYAEMPVPQPPNARRTVYMCEYLGHVSNYLLREHPKIWLENTVSDWERTGDFNFPQTSPARTVDPISLSGTNVIISLPLWKAGVVLGRWESGAILGGYILTYVTIVVAAVRIIRTPDFVAALPSVLMLAISAAAVSCIIAFCALTTYFTRYSLSLLPIFLICTGYTAESAVLLFQRKVEPPSRPTESGTRDPRRAL